MRGSMARGMRSRSSSGSSQSTVAAWTRAVTAAFVASVTWSGSLPSLAPPEMTQATQASTVPKHSSPRSARVRSGSTSSRMAITLVAEALGAIRMPSAWRARQVPTVRRSCQPMPGASGVPVARSHTMVEARWLAMPTPSTGPPSASAARATVSTAPAMTRRRTRPARARACRAGPARGARARRWRRGGRSPPAPRTCRRRRRGRCRPRRRSAARHHVTTGGGPKGEGRPNLPGLRMPLGSKVCFRPASTSKPAPRASGKKRERFKPMPW